MISFTHMIIIIFPKSSKSDGISLLGWTAIIATFEDILLLEFP
jgi:hypothetical protein